MKFIFDGVEFIDKLKKHSGVSTIRELSRFLADLTPSEANTSDPVKNWENKISRWKSGQYPSTADLVELAKVLRCSVDYLLGLDDAEPESTNPYYDFLVSASQLADQGAINLAVYRNTETVKDDPDNPFSEETEIRVFRPALVIRDNALCYYVDEIHAIRDAHSCMQDQMVKALLEKIRFGKTGGDTPETMYQWLDEFQNRFK